MNKLTMQTKLVIGSIVAIGASILATAAAFAQVPTVGTTDIANVGTPILTAMISNSEYVLEVFGPPLFVILLAFAVFLAIYHRVKVGHWL